MNERKQFPFVRGAVKTSVQILNFMASRVSLLYPPHNSLIMCFSIKLLAFWILFFQFSGFLVAQSITICLQVKGFSLNLQREPFSLWHSNTEAHHKEHETFSSPPTPTPTHHHPSPQLIFTSVTSAEIVPWSISLYRGGGGSIDSHASINVSSFYKRQHSELHACM